MGKIDGLYVNDEELKGCIERLKKWKSEFDEVDKEFKLKLTQMNEIWSGSDYEAMKKRVTEELDKITGENGRIQEFITGCTDDLGQHISDYQDIRNKNRSYWEEK